MISKVELEPGSTQVKIHYAVPVISAFSADTTGVTLASPRGFEPYAGGLILPWAA
jgi:hypothetical protein